MKKTILLMMFAFCAWCANAQNTRVVTGAVVDKNGNPLPNALVEATGGAESVATDADGSFRIEVPVWLKSLTAKYAGLQDKKVNLRGRSQVVFEMGPKTGSWFVDAVYSANFGAEDSKYFTRVGLMGGYLGKWGGYAKLLLPFGTEEIVPSVTLGVVKRVSTPVYLYLGVGYSPVYSYEYYKYYSGYDYYWAWWDGAMVDIGAIFKFNKVNFSVGYSISSDFDGYLNHSLQLAVGYCF